MMRVLTVFNLLQFKNDFWADVVLPEGLEKDTLVDTITLKYGPFDVYPQHPMVLKHYVDVWFKRKYNIFEKMLKTLEFEYDPIENYNRMETYDEKNDDTEDRTSDRVTTDEEGREASGKSTTKDVSTANDETTGQVSPFNAETWANDSKSISESGSTVDSDTDTSSTENRNQTTTQKDVDNIKNNRHKYYGLHAHGNIGVTTTQEMIKQERDVILYDVYLEIARMWADEFVILCS